MDLLDRLVIIKTYQYNYDEIIDILRIRCEIEKININDKALKTLTKHGEITSLRHCIQLLTPAKVIAETNGKDQIDNNDIIEATNIFLDAYRSSKRLHKNP